MQNPINGSSAPTNATFHRPWFLRGAHSDSFGIPATNAAGHGFSVAYANACGYDDGYSIATASGVSIARKVARNAYLRQLVDSKAIDILDTIDFWEDVLNHEGRNIKIHGR